MITRKYTLLLFDIKDSNSVKSKRQLTKKQKLGLEKGRIKREIKQFLNHEYDRILDYNRAVKWANKWRNDKFLILDTETTGLENTEIIEIAVINQDKQILINTLVKPACFIPYEVIKIHSITNEMVADAPCFTNIYDRLKEILSNQNVLIYNTSFDHPIINSECRRNELPRINFNSHCLMEMYAIFMGEYSGYYDDYKWQPLNGGHRALDDCLRAFEVLEEMADSTIDIVEYLYDIFFLIQY